MPNKKHPLAERVIYKLTSARFILAIIVGIVFAIMAVDGKFDSQDVREVVLVVMCSYFAQKRLDLSGYKNENGQDDQDDDEEPPSRKK